MELKQKLSEEVKEVMQDLYGLDSDIKLEKTNPKFKGDYTFVVFPYLKLSKKGPEQTAEDIGQKLNSRSSLLKEFNIVKGFLNLVIEEDRWIQALRAELSHEDIVIPDIGNGKKVCVEYSSPNTNKPLHLGHVRNNVLGFSMSRILENNGFKVIKTNIVNDRGVHICKSMLAWQKFAHGETPESAGIKGDHLVGKYYVAFDKAYKKEIQTLTNSGKSPEEAEKSSALMQEVRQMLKDWEAGDPNVIELWQTMNGWVYKGFDASYKRLGVEFDHIYYESDTYKLGKQIVAEGLDKGIFYKKKDGSIWADLTEEGLDHKLLMRADGTSVYITQDLGTAQKRFEDYKMDKSIYVVGNEQEYHFKVLALLFKKLNYPFWQGIYHLSYGMVDLPSGKMKSREGTVVDADDLMDEMVQTAKEQTESLGKTEGMSKDELSELYEILGLGALKYFLLKVDAKSKMMFDPAESIDFQGNTGPFIQYTHTRINSVLSAGGSFKFNGVTQLEEEELSLIQSMVEYPETVNEAAINYNPSLIATAAFELAKKFNRFYHQHSILAAENEDIKSFRLALSEQCGKVLKHSFELMGIQMPDRM